MNGLNYNDYLCSLELYRRIYRDMRINNDTTLSSLSTLDLVGNVSNQASSIKLLFKLKTTNVIQVSEFDDFNNI